MAQQPYQRPPAPGLPHSPLGPSTSPGVTQGFPLPPNKRQRVSPDPRSQPPSPYVQSPYAMSPNTGSSHLSAASTHFANISLPPHIYNTPYTNGNTAQHISLPSKNLSPSTYTSSNLSSNQPQNYYSPQTLNGNVPPNVHPNQQIQSNQSTTMLATGTMGPPSKPVDRDNANDDQMDVLANAGVDLRAEENFAMSFHTGSFNHQPKFSNSNAHYLGQSFTQFKARDATSYHGAGPANQPGESSDEATQDELEKKAADQAWAASAFRLAQSRQHELSHPHVDVAIVWRRMDRLAQENGLTLNTEGGKMPLLKLPSEFPAEVRVKTAVGSESAMVVTEGPFLPENTALADQLALLSLATNLRIRTVLEDAFALARGRCAGSHGNIPSEWVDASAPTKISDSSVSCETPRNGWESAISPRTNPPKALHTPGNRLPTPISDGLNTPTGTLTYTSEVVSALRGIGSADRDFEEARLLKRQSRASVNSAPRAASMAPGTPGSVAPEPSIKLLTKKEREKQDKSKQSVADSHAQANATTNKFLFGGKSKKKYSWMNGGAGDGSGSSTPSRLKTQGPLGTPGTLSSNMPEKQMLTNEGTKKWGLHREDKRDQPLLVDMRDLQAVLENDGREIKVLQEIYAWLEGPKNRKA